MARVQYTHSKNQHKQIEIRLLHSYNKTVLAEPMGYTTRVNHIQLKLGAVVITRSAHSSCTRSALLYGFILDRQIHCRGNAVSYKRTFDFSSCFHRSPRSRVLVRLHIRQSRPLYTPIFLEMINVIAQRDVIYREAVYTYAFTFLGMRGGDIL